MTGMISALVEAWQELRINKTRILLALVGVALSVAALTSVVGLGNLAREGFKASSEQNGGRAATLGIFVIGSEPSALADVQTMDDAVAGIDQLKVHLLHAVGGLEGVLRLSRM